MSHITLAGADLRTYLLTALADLLGLDQAGTDAEDVNESTHHFGEVPFWGELYVRNNE